MFPGTQMGRKRSNQRCSGILVDWKQCSRVCRSRVSLSCTHMVNHFSLTHGTSLSCLDSKTGQNTLLRKGSVRLVRRMVLEMSLGKMKTHHVSFRQNLRLFALTFLINLMPRGKLSSLCTLHQE